MTESTPKTIKADVTSIPPGLESLNLDEYVAHTEGISKAQVRAVVRRIFEWFTLALSEGRDVRVQDFGLFYTTLITDIKTKHPSTGESIHIEEKARLIFRPAQRTKKFIQLAIPVIKKRKGETGKNE